MIRYAAGRFAQALAVVLAVATLTFFIIRLAPGEPLSVLSESSRGSPEVREQERRNLGLDRPLYVQYLRFLGDLARGDLGVSFSRHRPVRDALFETIPNTLLLAVAALIVDFAAGIAIAVLQAARPGSRADRWLSVATLTLYSVPVFWLGAIALILFGQTLHWVPVGGMRNEVMGPSFSAVGRLFDVLRHLALPALTLGLVGAASTARFQRAALLTALRQDFVRTARAKGLPGRAVLVRHALRNALLPTITLLGLSLPVLLSGTVLVESVFAWPGMGRLTAEAFYDRDYPVVTAAALLSSTMVVVGSAVADLLYRLADPRTRAVR